VMSGQYECQGQPPFAVRISGKRRSDSGVFHGDLLATKHLLELGLELPEVVPEAGQLAPAACPESFRKLRRPVRHASQVILK